MAIASLIPGTDISVDRLDLAIDGWIMPEFKLRGALGEAQVEDGSTITDHFTALPDQIKVTGIVDSIRSTGERAADAWGEVMKLQREGAIVKFVAEFGVWNECLIKSASTTIKTRGLEFMLELQEIKRIGIGRQSSIAAAALDPTNPAANRQPEIATGNQTPAPVEPTEPVPVVIQSDGSVTTGILGGGAVTFPADDGNGNQIQRYTLPKPE